MVQIQTVRGWYCPECGTFNVIDDSIEDKDRCADCGYTVELEED